MRTHQGFVVHFVLMPTNGAVPVCGEKRDPRRRSTLDPVSVTCLRCMRSQEYNDALAAVESVREQERQREQF